MKHILLSLLVLGAVGMVGCTKQKLEPRQTIINLYFTKYGFLAGDKAAFCAGSPVTLQFSGNRTGWENNKQFDQPLVSDSVAAGVNVGTTWHEPCQAISVQLRHFDQYNQPYTDIDYNTVHKDPLCQIQIGHAVPSGDIVRVRVTHELQNPEHNFDILCP